MQFLANCVYRKQAPKPVSSWEFFGDEEQGEKMNEPCLHIHTVICTPC